MNRATIVAVAVVVFLLLSPNIALAGPSVDTVTILSGEKKKVTVDIVPSNIAGTTVSGPIQTVNRNKKNGSVVFTIKAGSPNNRRDAQLFINLKKGGERKVDFRVVPKGGGGGGGSIGGKVQQDAKKYRKIQDQWINQRVNRKTTGDGVQIVYEYRDPTKGPIDPKTGLPEGKWIAVSVNATTGEPRWPYESVSGLLAYQAKKAHRNYAWQRNTLMAAGAFGVAPWILAFIVVPWYRKRDERSVWPSITEE